LACRNPDRFFVGEQPLLVLQIERNRAYMVNRSVPSDFSVAKLARLPKLHPGQLQADQTEDRPDVGPLADTEVGEVPQSCPNTLAEINGWTDREPFWHVAVQYNEPQLVLGAATVGELRVRLIDWLMGKL
jgi:hypothetical protein